MSDLPIPPDNNRNVSNEYLKRRNQKHRLRIKQGAGVSADIDPTNDWLLWDILRLHFEDNESELFQILESLGYQELQAAEIVAVLNQWIFDIEPDASK